MARSSLKRAMKRLQQQRKEREREKNQQKPAVPMPTPTSQPAPPTSPPIGNQGASGTQGAQGASDLPFAAPGKRVEGQPEPEARRHLLRDHAGKNYGVVGGRDLGKKVVEVIGKGSGDILNKPEGYFKGTYGGANQDKKYFRDTAEGRQTFIPDLKGDYQPDAQARGGWSTAVNVPQEGVRDLLPNFGTHTKETAKAANEQLKKRNLSGAELMKRTISEGDAIRQNPRASDHRKFAAQLKQKTAGNPGYWSDPANAEELATMLDKGPEIGLTSAQIMKFIGKQKKAGVHAREEAESRDWRQGVLQNPANWGGGSTMRDPKDVAVARKRAYPDQATRQKVLLEELRKKKSKENGVDPTKTYGFTDSGTVSRATK